MESHMHNKKNNTVIFEHYIITRFNLPLFKAKLQNGEEVESNNLEYLKYRFQIFEDYCYHSIINQTCQNFKWLVLFDENTPRIFKDKIEKLKNRYSNFIPCFLNVNDYKNTSKIYIQLSDEYCKKINKPLYNELHDKYRRELFLIITPQFIKKNIDYISNNKPDYYITTRIDNDDAFHKDMIKVIQEKFMENPDNCVLEFPNTFHYIKKQKIVYQDTQRLGHFITLVEHKKDIFKSVLFYDHTIINKFVKIKTFNTQPYCIELLHDTNVVNTISNFNFINLIWGLSFRKRNFAYKTGFSLFNFTIAIINAVKSSIIYRLHRS